MIDLKKKLKTKISDLKEEVKQAYAEHKEERKKHLDLHFQQASEKQLIQTQLDASEKVNITNQEELNRLNEKVNELTFLLKTS